MHIYRKLFFFFSVKEKYLTHLILKCIIYDDIFRDIFVSQKIFNKSHVS